MEYRPSLDLITEYENVDDDQNNNSEDIKRIPQILQNKDDNGLATTV